MHFTVTRALILPLLLFPPAALTQTYSSYNINLISKIAPSTDTTPGVARYSGCWGWHQASKNREYAISGASDGTFFIDVTSPAFPLVSAFVKAHSSCTWREMKTYSHYCYIVSDVCVPNAFQIVDMQYLPDSVHIVHNSTALFNRAHTIWIDKDKMYVALVKFNGGSSAMAVYSLADPENPVLLRRIEQDSLNINEVHDMYVRNDTIYASAGWQGLHVLRLTAQNTFERLGSYSDYPFHGYNHSSFLTGNGNYMLFTDEVPNSLPMKLVDVSNFSNIQPVRTWNVGSLTTPHNPYIIGNDIAVVSCYQDGIWTFNISNPAKPGITGYFDTFPQGGFNAGDYGSGAYNGNWGAYPFLPSGIIIANDMSNGVFLLDPAAAYNSTVSIEVGIDRHSTGNPDISPNPASDEVKIRQAVHTQAIVEIYDMLGAVVFRETVEAGGELSVSTQHFPSGCYIVTVREGETSKRSKLIIRH